MKRHILSPALVFSCLYMALSTNASAQNTNPPPNLIALSIGYYDVFDDQDGTDFRVEYRPAKTILTENLKPWTGLEVTSQGSLWAGGGLLYDWGFTEKWRLTPSLGAGLYAKGGSDIDLDSLLQFRTQLEISHEFKENARLGLSLSHMSNANLGRSNPGTEVISLMWAMPFNKP